MSQIAVIALMTAKPGCEAALAAELATLVPPTRQEAGCLRYDLHRDPQNPASLAFLETWASREAHQAHLKTPHFLASRERQANLVANRDVRIMEKI